MAIESVMVFLRSATIVPSGMDAYVFVTYLIRRYQHVDRAAREELADDAHEEGQDEKNRDEIEWTPECTRARHCLLDSYGMWEQRYTSLRRKLDK